MNFWNFIGSFALFNAVCDMFSSKSKRTYAPSQQFCHDYDHDDYPGLSADEYDIDALHDRIDEFQDRIDCLEEWEDIQDELDDLHDRDLYDDHYDW